MKKLSLIVILPLVMIGCNKSPYDRTTGGVVTGSGTGPAGSFVVFYNELSSGGGAFEFPGGDNQTLSFADTSNPISHFSIRYNWTGQDVLNMGAPQHAFAGFDLMHVASLSDYAADAGVNLSSKGYTKVTFYARGTLSASTLAKVEVAGGSPQPCLSLSTNGSDDDPMTPCGRKGQLTSSWQSYTISLPVGSLSAVKDYFKVTYIYTGGVPVGSGGTIYLDRIEYEP